MATTPRLRMLRHSSPDGPTCPAFYDDADSDMLVVVCKKITDPTLLAEVAPGVGDDEIVGLIPKSLAPEVLPHA